jgi:hypothetical protein
MAQSQEYLEDNLRRRYWEDFSGSPYSDHREPENKRQCLEAAFAGSAITTLKAGTVTSTLTPISQFDDFGAIEPLEDTWSDFQDRQDQQPSNYENITTVDFGTALPRDLVTNSSDFCLEVPEAAGPEELLLTPGSAYDHSDFDAEAVLTSQGSATNEATISRDVPEKPDHVCFGMVSGSFYSHNITDTRL